MAKILSNPVLDALRAAGIADDNTRRVVIDIGVDLVPVVYIERFGDSELLDVIKAISGVDIVRVPASRPAEAPAGE